MDIPRELRDENRKAQITRMVDWVGHDPGKFRLFLELMTGPDRRLAQRAAWVVGDCSERHPQLAVPHLPALLDNLARPGLHDAVVRHTFRVLQFTQIPPRLEGRVFGLAMAALGGTAPVAAKAYALTVLKRLSKLHPAALTEVRALLGEIMPQASPGIRARVRREFGPRAGGNTGGEP